MATAPKLTPMLAQYRQIKEAHPDSILFYRMGDFYEMFFEDAVRAAPVLEVQLTSRDKNSDNPIPMCGVPHHSASAYVQKLLAQGFKVALCEQVENPALAKGIVKREVVRVLTPALIGDPDIVSDEAANVLASLGETERGEIEICLFDLLGGRARLGREGSWRTVVDVLYRTPPKEFLVPESVREKKWFRDLRKLFPQALVTCRTEYFTPPATGGADPISFAAVKQYLKETQKTDHFPYLPEPTALGSEPTMALDATTLRSLEVLQGQSLESDGHSLFQVLNFTRTPMGRRTLKEWLARPLREPAAIEARLEAVGEFLDAPAVTEELRSFLADVRDLERLTMKTALGLAMPRDLVAIRGILKTVSPVEARLQRLRSPLLRDCARRLDPLEPLVRELEAALEDEPPATLSQGGIFRGSYHPQVGEYRELAYNAKSTIAAMEGRERERTGIPTLKIKFNKVFGYTIEVTRANLSRVPEDYIRKQTIAGGERYITEELKSFEEKVITAEQKLKGLEESLFLELRKQVSAHTESLLRNARVLAEVDVLLGFAEAARERDYRRPQVHGGDTLEIEDGRHPVVETLLPRGEFVPNSVSLSESDCRTLVITGPNMAGKSTIMRQVALIAVMAQTGSFVPARSARLPCLDAIFTRIGSSDDLAQGRSTFMVEMTEVARILEQATPRSLILIDEIGRGTSTYDGLSLAWSLLEYIHTQVRAKTLFATHFHEVTALEKHLPALRNANVLVDRWEDEIVFLHRLAPGICNRSYGVEVAGLAGLPGEVLSRAREILGHLEGQSQRATRARNRALEVHDNQMALFDPPARPENRAEREGPTP